MKKTIFPAIASIILLTGCGIPSVHPLYEQGDLILDDSFTGIWEQDNGAITWHVMPLRELEQLMTQLEDSSTGNWAVESPDVAVGDSIVKGAPVLTRTIEVDTDRFSGEIEATGSAESEFRFGYDEATADKLYIVQRRGKDEGFFIVGMVEIGGNNYLDFHQLRYLENDPFNFPVHIFMKISRADDETLFIHYFDDSWLSSHIKNRQVRIRHERTQTGSILLTAPTRELREFVRRYGDIEEAYRTKDTFKRIASVPEFDFDSY
jgi:hypothetical protein